MCISPDAKQFPELQWELQNRAPHAIRLPALPPDGYEPDFTLEPTLDHFCKPNDSALAPALAAIETVARSVSLDTAQRANEAAKHLLSLLSAAGQLSGWQHLQNYITDPKLYHARTMAAQRGEPHASTRLPAPTGLHAFQSRAQLLLKRLCQRIDWLLQMQSNANQPFDADLCMGLIAADHAWAADASSFMRDAEANVTEMLAHNQLAFQAFRTAPTTLASLRPTPLPRSRISDCVDGRGAAAQGCDMAPFGRGAARNRGRRLCLSSDDDQTGSVRASHASACLTFRILLV